MTAPETSPSRWSLRGLARTALIAALAIGAGAGLAYLIAHERPPAGAQPSRPAAKPPSADDLALIAPLAQGADLGGFTVREIEGVQEPDGTLALICQKGEATLRVEIALSDPRAPLPPATVGPYSIYYSLLQNATGADGMRLAEALAAIMKANEGAKPPPGMKPLPPATRPITL